MTHNHHTVIHTYPHNAHKYRLSALALGILVSFASICVKAEEPEQIKQSEQVDELTLESDSTPDSQNESTETKNSDQENADQYEQALIALRLKKAVEQGIIDPSVLEEYQRETLNNQNQNDDNKTNDLDDDVDVNIDGNNEALIDHNNLNNNFKNDTFVTDNLSNTNETHDEPFGDAFEQAAAAAQVTTIELPEPSGISDSPEQIDELLQSIDTDTMADFDAPVARLDSNAPPIGLNTDIDNELDNRLTSLSNPNMADLVHVVSHRGKTDRVDINKTEPDATPTPTNAASHITDSNAADIISVNDTRASIGRVTLDEDLTNSANTNNNRQSSNLVSDTQQSDPNNTVANDITATDIDSTQAQDLVTERAETLDPVSDALISERDTVSENDIDANTNKSSTESQYAQSRTVIDPDDYLPEYDKTQGHTAQADAVEDAIVSDNAQKPDAYNDIGFFKGLYNRLFNGGYMRLPRVNANVYLQDESRTTDNGEPVLVAADDDVQPINNIKAAIEEITVESVSDFRAALPRLKQEALDAAQAVGYYDVSLRFEQPSQGDINIIIERLGEPVSVNSRLIDIRGEGEDNSEFEEIRQNAIPFEDDVFNHGAYEETKLAIASVSDRYGYFDGNWLNTSVDVILPDNTADVDLIYDTGPRYDFGEVVYYTYDENTGQLTTDPDKLPVNLELLNQLYRFEQGDDYYRPLITEFTNNLSATRYFNSVNVEVVKPVQGANTDSTLLFENDSNADGSNDANETNDEVSITANNTDDTIQNNGTGSNEQEQINAEHTDSDTNVDADTDLDANADANVDNSQIYNVDNINNNADIANSTIDDSDMDSSETASVSDDEDIEPIEFSVDEETSEKLQAVKAKSERLISLPDDRVLDEQDEEARNILGKISNAISNIAKKILPDDEDTLADVENGITPKSLEDRITAEQAYDEKIVPIYVFVISDKPKDAQLGVGYGTDTGMRVVAQLDHNLINRDGYQAGIRVGASEIRKSVDLHASRPWNHPLNDTLNATLAYEQESINQGEGNLDLETDTLKVGFNRSIRPISGWDRTYSLKYRIDELESGVTGTDRADLPVPFNREDSKFTQQSLLLGYALSKVQSDNITDPTHGFSQYYSLEVGSDSVLTDTNMAIVRARLGGVYSFGEFDRHQIVASLDGGYIWADDFEDVPYKQRFFAGGDRSLRGYDYQSLSTIEKGYLVGGQVLALGSAEYNYEFRPNFRAAVFADVGNAYDTNFETETKLGVGAGIRWSSPVGLVRLDLAAGVLEDDIPIRLHFFIGSPLQ